MHIISFFHIKPAQRLYLINPFRAKAQEQNIDMGGLKLINTSMDSIYKFTKY